MAATEGSNEYSVLYAQHREGGVSVGDFDPSVLKRKYLLSRGVSRIAEWPRDVVLEPHAAELRIPSGARLDDCIDTLTNMFVVNERFRDLLMPHCGPELIEFLPIGIRPRRRAKVVHGYFVANPLRLLAAVDWSGSDVDRDRVDEKTISVVRKLAFLPEVVASGPMLFRIAELPWFIAVRRPLAEAIANETLSGIALRALEDFPTTSLGVPED